MSSVHLRWVVAGEVQLDRQFTRLAIDVDDFEVPLREAGDIIYDETRAQFAAEGDPEWDKLNPTYAARKARLYPGQPILVATGALRASLTDPGAAGAVYEVTSDTLTIGTDIMVGRWNLGLIHQQGAENANVPARPMMRLRNAAKTRIISAFRNWFISLADRRSLGVA